MVSQSNNMDKKHKIYKAALELFTADGFYGSPTSAIAKKAGVANGTLFHYFPTKETLIKALYMELKDNFLLSITENYNRKESYRERVKLLWSGIIHWAYSDSMEFRFIQQFSNSPYLNHLTKEQKTRHDLFFMDLFEEGLTKNILKELSVDLLIQTSLSQVYGLIEYIYQYPSFINDKAKMDLAFDSFWDAISK